MLIGHTSNGSDMIKSSHYYNTLYNVTVAVQDRDGDKFRGIVNHHLSQATCFNSVDFFDLVLQLVL
mgnify:CR=1 FL=1